MWEESAVLDPSSLGASGCLCRGGPGSYGGREEGAVGGSEIGEGGGGERAVDGLG